MTIPNFLLIGAPKSGTSSLYEYLQQHPQIYMSPVKEPHFFTFENQSPNFKGPGDFERLKGLITNLEEYQNLFTEVTTEVAIGEASTTYLKSARACQNIAHHLPDAKLIAILRNPIETSFSSYLHLIRDGYETIKDFSQALQQEEQRIANGWEELWHYKQRGFYYHQVKQYFETFPSEQIKVYIYDDFVKQPLEIVKDIFVFLGVDSTFNPQMLDKYNVSAMPKSQLLNRLILTPNLFKSIVKFVFPDSLRQQISQSLKAWNFKTDKPTLSPEIRMHLAQDYQEDIEKLQTLLDRDLSHWLSI